MYGEHALDFMKKYGAELGIGLATLALASGIFLLLLRRRRQASA
jgi:hypothetical protein